ncbi:MAG: hypothetical protein AB7H86_14185 [Blastocatellales bacterium]|nr:hypothetical protein [Nitrosomonas nitrosa]
MPIFIRSVLTLLITAACAGSGWAQNAAVYFETEAVFNRQGEPFTQLVFALNRSLRRAPAYSWQLAADAWVGGEDPYLAVRLEACRRFERGTHSVQSCGGLGVYYEVRAKDASPVAAVSAEGALWGGRITQYASFERAFASPTFTYYHVETSAAILERNKFRVTAGLLSRTIQRAAGKLALDFASHGQLFATAGSGQVTAGFSLRF